MEEENLSITLKEVVSDEKDTTYTELVDIVNLMENNVEPNMEDFVAMEVHFQTNFTKPQIEKIAEYYKISKRKKRKDELIQDIVVVEIDPNNIQIVFRRKKLWSIAFNGAVLLRGRTFIQCPLFCIHSQT